MTKNPVKSKIEDIYPLSPMQQGMLFHSLFDPSSPVYSERNTLTLEGDLDIDALRIAWDHLSRSHPLFRTIFRWKGVDEPVQIVLREKQPVFRIIDLSALTEDERKARIREFLDSDRKNTFDLSKGPLMRLHVLLLGERKYCIVWSYHHILMDGWCQSLVMNDLFLSYLAASGGQPLPEIVRPAYRQYISWLKKQDRAASEKYWKGLLGDFDSPTAVPTDYRPADRSGFKLDKHTMKLSAEMTASLAEIARRSRITMSTLVQGAWSLLLNRYSRQDDVVFGVTISGRPAEIPGSDQMIGLFINSLPVRARFKDDRCMGDLLRDLQTQSLKIQEYGFSFLPDVKACSAVPRSTALFNSIVIFENFPTDYRNVGIGGGIRIIDSSIEEMTNFDFTLFILPGEELELSLHYATDLFTRATIARMMDHLPVIFSAMVRSLDTPLSQLDILPAEELELQLKMFNATAVDYERDKCTFELFERRAEEMPDAVALAFEDEKLTYRELNEKANRLARLLRRRGVAPDTIVGILVERSMEMIIGILGILKAGGAYLPLDPSYPDDRVKYMLDDSGAGILLTQGRFSAKLDKIRFAGDAIDIFDQSVYAGDASNLERSSGPENLAYVIYTSGSTGKPKGVMLEHRNVVNFIKGMTDIIDFSAGKTIVNLTTISFDIFVLETHLALAHGLTIAIADERDQNDPVFLKKVLEKNHVNMLQSTPSRLRLMMGSPEFVDCLANLSEIMVGGEPFPETLLEALKASYRGKIYNVYGPTETTVWSTVQDLTGAATIDIGKPIANTQIYIVDRYGRLLPSGVSGELCIGGDGLARGYLNRPELTADKFVPNHYEPGRKMYRTGDLARWLADGNIECHGRVDYQVKIRGHRIELGEIEAHLASHEMINDVTVIDRQDREGNKYLVSYYVSDEEIPLSELRSFLKETLPDYMIPSKFIHLDALPLTPNGKVDRKALPDPEDAGQSSSAEYVAPRNDIEKLFSNLWGDVLGVARVGIHDNFFDLGGHSLLIMKVLARMQMSYPVTVQDFFDYQTVAELAQCAEKRMQDACAHQNALPGEKEELKPVCVNMHVSGKKESPGGVLLTGATGYLGAHLLYEFLKLTGANMYCLVRAENDEQAASRLRSAVDFYFGDRGGVDYSRVTAVRGDVQLDELGLDPAVRQKLLAEVDTIVHAAADVRHYGAYEHFRNVNALGTKRMLDFAFSCSCKRFHHVSTMGVCGDYIEGKAQAVFCEDHYDRAQVLGNVYAKSKFEAEGMVREAMACGLNATIHRVGILVGESATGRFQKSIDTNAFYGLLKGLIHLGAILDLPGGSIEMTPIDSCREAMVNLMLMPETSNRCLHLYNPKYVSYEGLAKCLQSYGYDVRLLPVGEYLSAMREAANNGRKQESLENLVPHLAGSASPRTAMLYDNSVTQHLLDAIGFSWPVIDDGIVHRILDYCVKTGFVIPPALNGIAAADSRN